MIDPFIFNTTPDIDPAIVAEFAHTSSTASATRC